MTRWDSHFQAISHGSTASFSQASRPSEVPSVFGVDPYESIIGAAGPEVSTSPTPKGPWTFDLGRVPPTLWVALSAAGVLLVAATSHSLGRIQEYERHAAHRGEVKISHVRRKPLVGHAKERAWALREALARTPSGLNYSAVTRRDVG
jgi:hypothetical protein